MRKESIMKVNIKLTAALIALLILLSALAACSKPQDEINSGSTTASPEATVEPSVTTSQFVDDDIPDSLKINDTVTFLYWKDVERPEFFVDEASDDGNIVNTRIRERNDIVKNRLNVDIEWVGTVGNFNNQKNFIDTASNSVSGGGGYDVFAGYSMTGATLAMNGLVQNLLELENLNFEKPWWPESLVATATINDKLYFSSGDISTNLLYMMYACFFNKDMLIDEHSDMTVNDIYKIVKEGKWTLDKLIELCDGVYRDENANNTIDYEDKFGFETIDLHFDAFYIGSDLKFLEKKDDGSLKLSDDVASTKTITLLEKVTDFLYDSGYAFGKGTTAQYSSAQAFGAGRVLFTIDRVYIASGTLKDVSDFKYGMLPIPKYDEEQDDYKTCMAFPFTLYSVSVTAKDPNASAATLECLASESYRRVTPALFEQSMKIRYSDDAEDSFMYDTIRRTVAMDLSRIFTTPLKNYSYSAFRQSVKDDAAAGWARKIKSISGPLQSSIDEINSALIK